MTNILGPLRAGTYSILKSLSVHVRLHPVYSALLLQVHELLEGNVCVEKCDVALLAKRLQYEEMQLCWKQSASGTQNASFMFAYSDALKL